MALSVETFSVKKSSTPGAPDTLVLTKHNEGEFVETAIALINPNWNSPGNVEWLLRRLNQGAERDPSPPWGSAVIMEDGEDRAAATLRNQVALLKDNLRIAEVQRDMARKDAADFEDKLYKAIEMILK